MATTNLTTTLTRPTPAQQLPDCDDCREWPVLVWVAAGDRAVCADCAGAYCVVCGAEDAIFTDEAMESTDPEGLCAPCLDAQSARRAQ